MFSTKNSTALITGATSGIGEAIARALAHKGVHALILVARNADKLTHIARELAVCGVRVETIALDLTDADAAQRVKAETDRLGLTVDLLVNNAGIGSLGPFDCPVEKPGSHASGDIVALNVAAVVALTQIYLPGMVERKRGGVIHLGSTAGFQPIPYSAIYGASKAFVISFSQALWAELQDRGLDEIRMICLCPGVTDTNFAFGHGEPRQGLEMLSVSTPSQVAVAALEALDKGTPRPIVGRANEVFGWFQFLVPAPLAASLLARQRRRAALDFVGERGQHNDAPALPRGLARAALPFIVVPLALAGALLARTHRRARWNRSFDDA